VVIAEWLSNTIEAWKSWRLDMPQQFKDMPTIAAADIPKSLLPNRYRNGFASERRQRSSKTGRTPRAFGIVRRPGAFSKTLTWVATSQRRSAAPPGAAGVMMRTKS
jgi:hypothetical protein